MRWVPFFAFLAVVVQPGRTWAVTRCLSPDAFNTEATSRGMVVSEGTLTMQVTGIDPGTFPKGALANLVDTRDQPAAGSACTGIHLKIFGTEVPTDTGKVKDELYNMCCPTGDCAACTSQRNGPAACETWAGPARSTVLFTSPSQTCTVVVHLAPGTHGYDITCDNGVSASGTGDEPYHLVVNRVSVLRGVGGEQPMDNASLISAQFCFTDPGTVVTDAGATVDAGACGTGNPLRAVSLVPTSGSGSSQTFQAVYENCYGAGAFRIVQFYVGDSVAAGMPSVHVSHEAGVMGYEGQQCAPGSAAVLTGTRGTLDCSRSSVTTAGNRMTVSWALGFNVGSFGGTHNTYFDAKGPMLGAVEARLGWTQLGTFTVVASPVDAGPGVDAAQPVDASTWPDVSTPADAAVRPDASAPVEAGTPLDAAGGADHPAVSDGGTGAADAAGALDAGEAEVPRECSCDVAPGAAQPVFGLLALLFALRRVGSVCRRG